MGEPIDAVDVMLRWEPDASSTPEEIAVGELDYLFSAGGIEGDGDLVLRRSGDTVTVAGRLERGDEIGVVPPPPSNHLYGLKGTADFSPLYRIVEPS